MNNKDLYETAEVVSKYSANNTRVRSLNNPEKVLIDRFNIKDKDVLVLGGGAGRLAVNLLIYGNKVVSVDRSEKLTDFAKKTFPPSKFGGLTFELADMTDLSKFQDNIYDVVIFPMNSLDYLENDELRHKSLMEASKKIKAGGLLIFSSHNKLAYALSPKVRLKDRKFPSFFLTHEYANESVVGGGKIYKGNPGFIVSDTKHLTNFSFIGIACDCRNRIDSLMSKSIKTAQFWFPYLAYVFKK
jgi:SAM-dependent methyltransferase